MAVKRFSDGSSIQNSYKMGRGATSAAIPEAPTIGAATSTDDSSATVAYTAATLGGLGTTFTATSTPSSITGTGASPITVSGLTGSTSYTFTVTSGNANGTSSASSASGQITTDAFLGRGYDLNYEPYTAYTDRLAYATETISNIAGVTTAIIQTYGANNSGTAGYLLGAYAASATNTIGKFTFSTETGSTLAATLSGNGYYGGAVGNKGSAAYMFGGINFGTAIQKLAFSNDTRTTISATISTNNTQNAGLSNSGTAGYKLGGAGTSSNTCVTKIEKLTYSGETMATLSAVLSITTAAQYAFSNNAVAGYTAGGQGNLTTGQPVYTTINKLVYSNDTCSAISATMQSADTLGVGVSNTGTAGYMLGGITNTTRASKLAYGTDTRTTLSATLSRGLWYGGGLSNEPGV